jgi:putative membrane protein
MKNRFAKSIFLFIKKNLFVCMLYCFYAVGIIGHVVDFTFPYMIMLTPYVLLIFGILVLYYATDFDRRLLMWCCGTYIFTFCIEALGVYTGEIFGSYHYGDTLGIKVFAVPLVIGFNWVLVVLGAISIAQKFVRHTILIVVLAGALTVVFDIPLEIVAVNLDYWHWQLSSVPIQNYVAWFLVAVIVAFVFTRCKLRAKSNVAVHYYYVQFMFFVLIDILLYAGAIHALSS